MSAQTAQQHILVVEDDTSLRLIIQDILEAGGYQVYVASHGQEALDLLAWLRPDLIVSDIMMPVMDGLQFFSRVRTRPEWLHIPFIFLSARGSKLDIMTGKQLGADDYLVKPFDADELLVAVNSKLAIAERWRQVREHELQQIKQNILRALNHEFRTPLTYISAYTEILADSGGQLQEEDFREFCQAIQRGTTRLQKLIEDFLLLAQLETGEARRTFEDRRMPIHHWQSLLQGATMPYLAEAQAKQIRIGLEVSGHLQPVVADTVYLEDAIGRLVQNAVKFSPAGADPIIVGASMQDDQLAITVRDHGIGMRPEVVQDIFLPLHQVDRDKMEQQGTGSGLAIARAIVTMHGGDIEVESAFGEGSTFRVLLPAPAGESSSYQN